MTPFFYVFGLDFEAPGTDDALADDLMALLIDLRAQARADKQFALADAIRDRLKDLGIVLKTAKTARPGNKRIKNKKPLFMIASRRV